MRGIHLRDRPAVSGRVPAPQSRLGAVSRTASPRIAPSGLRFAVAKEPEAKPRREPRPKVKNDPRLVAAARELRDRWLERVNADASALAGEGKYDVSRRIEGREAEREPRLLAG